jgi:plasmid stabilization system protein ParE
VTLHRTAVFIADVERQYEWYAVHANPEIADRYLAAVEATCALIAAHPRIGPLANCTHPRLAGWRFLTVLRPFQRHLVFYEITADTVVLRRAMHGHRDLPRRLPETP